MNMARLMCIATHHKGGTVWIKSAIKRLSRTLGLPWLGIWSEAQLDLVPRTGRAFLCNWHGSFPKALWESAETAFLHVIRDPRDILLSGMKYHRHAAPEGERFLHRKRADLGGRTYQEHLNNLSDDLARLRFEMDEKHAETLAEMRAWPWGDPRCAELRYETLIKDHSCDAWTDALRKIGLSATEAGRKALWDTALFGGAAKAGATRSGHVNSGQPRRWARELPRALGPEYANRFGADIVALGYETDTSWVAALPDVNASGADTPLVR